MRTRIAFALVAALGVASLGSSPAYPETDDEVVEVVDLEAFDGLLPNASIFEVIANPEKFATKEVCFVGVLAPAGRDRLSIVYTSTEAHKHRISVNGIALHFDSTIDRSELKDADGKYVAVLGVLESDSARIRQFLHPLHAILVHGRLLRVTKVSMIEKSPEAAAQGR
ncbi:MAG TPA: hypothetical protein VMM36_02440 [Opitutaceae bacterium]|nr:hypothetical protein [Opitutaceae bacterium]